MLDYDKAARNAWDVLFGEDVPRLNCDCEIGRPDPVCLAKMADAIREVIEEVDDVEQVTEAR